MPICLSSGSSPLLHQAQTLLQQNKATCNHSTRNFTLEFWAAPISLPILRHAALTNSDTGSRSTSSFESGKDPGSETHYKFYRSQPDQGIGSFHLHVMKSRQTTQCRAEHLDIEHHHKGLFCLYSGKLGLDYACTHQEVQVQHCTGFLDAWLKWKPQLLCNTNFQGDDHKVRWN